MERQTGQLTLRRDRQVVRQTQGASERKRRGCRQTGKGGETDRKVQMNFRQRETDEERDRYIKKERQVRV